MLVHEKQAMPKARLWRGFLLGVVLLEVQFLSAQPVPTAADSPSYLILAKSSIAEGRLGEARQFLRLAGQQEGDNPFLTSLRYSLLFSLDSMEGNFQSALQDRIRYKAAHDAYTSDDQNKQLAALKLRYATEKKDRSILLLRQQKSAQKAGIDQNRLIGNILIVGVLLLIVVIGLLIGQYRLKRRAVAEMNRNNFLLQSLAEKKEWLLQEVNQRVKQNLHIVMRLLESQTPYLKDDALRAVENSKNRIFAMSLIHQKLTHDANPGGIDMSVYLPELIGYLDQSLDAHSHIEIQLQIQPILLGIPQAIPLALIANEAVTNSIKYAFPNDRKGIIIISLSHEEGKVQFMVADNGVGFEWTDDRRGKSMGLKLIKGLLEELNGSARWETKRGTQIIMDFPLYPVSREVFEISQQADIGI